MTNTQLKAQIDNNITNETTPLGITPSDVGGNIKAVVDYVDQEVATDRVSLGNKVDKVSGERLINATEITKLSNTSGTNTGDQDISGKENISNKSTNVTTDGASDTKYPSVKSIKNYVDNSVAANELWSNKSTNIDTDGASDVKYPSVKSVKTYVDNKFPYKSYVALISQVGTDAPTVIILSNTFSGTITWTRTSVGRYTGTISTTEFVNLKTFFILTPISGDLICSINSQTSSTVSLDTWSPSSAAFLDGQLNETSLEIRVYN